MASRPIEILLIEDSPGDVWLTRQILLQGSVPKNITVVTDGEQALNYLYARGLYKDAKRPDLVLLDLNLPRRNGLEVLSEIKRDPALRSITVIVLTTSEAVSDVNAAYNLNANCYIVKPIDLEAFTTAIQSIEEFWLSMALLPSTLPPTTETETQADAAAPGGPAAESNGSGPEATRRKARRFVPVCKRVRYAGKHAHFSVAGCGGGARHPRSARCRATAGPSRH